MMAIASGIVVNPPTIARANPAAFIASLVSRLEMSMPMPAPSATRVPVQRIRSGNIYAPNGNPVGSDRFAYKLAWMDRLTQQMIRWKQDHVPTLIGGDFNVIPEDIDCHKPSSWEHDALFQPEPRARYRAMLGIGYTDAFRSLHVGEIGHFTFWDYFRQAFQNNRGIRIDHFLLSPTLADRLESCEIDKGPRAQEKPSDHAPIIVTLSDKDAS